MKKIRDAKTVLGLLEDGDLAADFSAELNALIQKLREVAGPKTSAKGSITLKLDISMEGISSTVDATIDVKAPKAKRVSTFFYVTDDGLSTEHPRQLGMEFGVVGEKS
jgi:hypothetical protein